MQRRDQSQVVTYAQGWTDPQWLGAIGHVTGLTTTHTYPGGPSQMSLLLQIPPGRRVTAMNPGRLARVYRGGSCTWNGQLDEPQPDTGGWTVTAHGSGTFGAQYRDIWTTWSDPDDHLDQAIARGLDWTNPGLSGVSGLWLGDQADPGSQTITDFLNSITVQGALGWTIGRSDNRLAIAPVPAAVTRLLIVTVPVARTIAAAVNSLFIRYEASADSGGGAAAAAYGLAGEINQADADLHGTTEDYYDDSGNGVITLSQAQANARSVLSLLNRASFAGPFQAAPGQLLNIGGAPVDLGAEQAGEVTRLLLTDFGYGGEVVPSPVTFVTGEYSCSDSAQAAQITPWQSARDDLQSLLAAVFPAVSVLT
jgi:hypothetical protein